MFYKIYERLPPSYPLNPYDVKHALDSIFNRNNAARGWPEISPLEALIIIALSWGYGNISGAQI